MDHRRKKRYFFTSSYSHNETDYKDYFVITVNDTYKYVGIIIAENGRLDAEIYESLGNVENALKTRYWGRNRGHKI